MLSEETTGELLKKLPAINCFAFDPSALAIESAAHQVIGCRDLSRTDVMDVLRQVISTEPPPIEQLAPHVPTEAGDVLRRALSKDPEDRFGRCREFSAAVSEQAAHSATGIGAHARRRTARSTIVGLAHQMSSKARWSVAMVCGPVYGQSTASPTAVSTASGTRIAAITIRVRLGAGPTGPCACAMPSTLGRNELPVWFIRVPTMDPHSRPPG